MIQKSKDRNLCGKSGPKGSLFFTFGNPEQEEAEPPKRAEIPLLMRYFNRPFGRFTPLKKEQQHPKEENKIGPRELYGTDFAPDFGF